MHWGTGIPPVGISYTGEGKSSRRGWGGADEKGILVVARLLSYQTLFRPYMDH